MRRFFVEPRSISQNLAILSPEESRHVAMVLRLKAGAAVELFDGTGLVYQGLILTASPKRITIEILSRYRESGDRAVRLFLFQGMLKGKKMDFLVQKATELGVHAFCPVPTRYSENHGNLARQVERWRRIMLEACKQSRRAHPMAIEPVLSLEDMTVSGFDRCLMLWESEQTSGIDATHVSYEGPMALLVGPEGGFHEDDVGVATAKGFRTVSFGPRVLRAETAALSAIAILQFLGGALSPVDGKR